MNPENAKEVFIEKFYDSSLRKEDTPFTQVYNFVVQNFLHHESLSIWLYLQTKPKTWCVNRNELLDHFVFMGRDKIEKCIAILKAVGLIEIYSIREAGKIVGWETYVKCGIGCEEKILEFKKKWQDEQRQKKDKKSTPFKIPENQDLEQNQIPENAGSGEKVKIPHKTRAEKGCHQIPENPGSGKSGYIERNNDQKERKKERNTTTRKRVDGDCVLFDSFWKTYPHHFPASEKTCRSIWVNRKLESIAPTIIEAVENFLATDFRWIGQHAPSAKTFLLQDIWTQEPMLDSNIKKQMEAKAKAEQTKKENEQRAVEQERFTEHKRQEDIKNDRQALNAIKNAVKTGGGFAAFRKEFNLNKEYP